MHVSREIVHCKWCILHRKQKINIVVALDGIQEEETRVGCGLQSGALNDDPMRQSRLHPSPPYPQAQTSPQLVSASECL
jgi:hypothetical protein